MQKDAQFSEENVELRAGIKPDKQHTKLLCQIKHLNDNKDLICETSSI